jgi:hypothetical protein
MRARVRAEARSTRRRPRSAALRRLNLKDDPAAATLAVAALVGGPALADERVQLNDVVQVELKLDAPWRDGTTHLSWS